MIRRSHGDAVAMVSDGGRVGQHKRAKKVPGILPVQRHQHAGYGPVLLDGCPRGERLRLGVSSDGRMITHAQVNWRNTICHQARHISQSRRQRLPFGTKKSIPAMTWDSRVLEKNQPAWDCAYQVPILTTIPEPVGEEVGKQTNQFSSDRVDPRISKLCQ